MELKDVAQAMVEMALGSHFVFGEHIALLEAATAPHEASRQESVCLLPWSCSLFLFSSLLATCHRSRHPGPVRVWLLLLCACMNLLFLGPQFDKVPVCSPCPLQIEALGNLASEVEFFIDDLNTVLVAADWEALMKSTAVSYTGEEVFPAEELDHARLCDTFPAPKHGGAVPMVQVVDASLRHILLHPELLIMPKEQWEPFPKVPPKV